MVNFTKCNEIDTTFATVHSFQHQRDVTNNSNQNRMKLMSQTPRSNVFKIFNAFQLLLVMRTECGHSDDWDTGTARLLLTGGGAVRTEKTEADCEARFAVQSHAPLTPSLCGARSLRQTAGNAFYCWRLGEPRHGTSLWPPLRTAATAVLATSRGGNNSGLPLDREVGLPGLPGHNFADFPRNFHDLPLDLGLNKPNLCDK